MAFPGRPGGSGLTCPRDGAALAATSQGGHDHHLCAECGGRFIPGATFPALAAAVAAMPELQAPPGSVGPVRYLRCPSCAGPLHRHNYLRVSGVVIDECRACGVWLDAGELERIGVFLAAGGLGRATTVEDRLAEERLAARRSLDRREWLEDRARGQPNAGSVDGGWVVDVLSWVFRGG